MNDPQTPTKLIDQLRAWFFAKDRSVYLAPNTFIDAPEIATPGTPAAGRRRLYTKSGGWYGLESSGSEYRFATFEIATTTLSASAASVTFSNIPGIYKHLCMFVNARTDRGGGTTSDFAFWRANGDGAANYNEVVIQAGSAGISSAVSLATASPRFLRVDATASTAGNFGGGLIYWNNYSNTSIRKTYLSWSITLANNAAANVFMHQWGGDWMNTAAITSLVISPTNGPNFVASSTFALYGIV